MDAPDLRLIDNATQILLLLKTVSAEMFVKLTFATFVPVYLEALVLVGFKKIEK